jgi:hypothetical protein
VDKDSLHIWPRGSHFLMGLANLDGSFTMTLYMHEKGDVSFEKLKTKEQVEAFFSEHYPTAVRERERDSFCSHILYTAHIYVDVERKREREEDIVSVKV